MSSEFTPPPLPPMPPSMPSIPPPPPMQNETVNLVIEKVTQKTGVFSKQAYRMVVTNTRLIFSVQEKKGIDYMRQDPNLSLAENPANFFVPLDQLQVIEIYPGDFESNSPDTMVVKSLGNKTTYMITDAYRVGQNLKRVLGNKVK